MAEVEELRTIECEHGKVTIISSSTFDAGPDGIQFTRGEGPLEGTAVMIVPTPLVEEVRADDRYITLMYALTDVAQLWIHTPGLLD